MMVQLHISRTRLLQEGQDPEGSHGKQASSVHHAQLERESSVPKPRVRTGLISTKRKEGMTHSVVHVTASIQSQRESVTDDFCRNI